ncbi:Hypothetical predicted protein [Olea europaea subsp. europaea]|uniref:Uncharacterized protein n=1 Tax=Olea europaea subsp. europaea TaxID=158383 RepID=A0A8S0Q9X8_OLEEU|nr:Hypothetical predicted protein [Olea europaea subsp. europaea]
MAQWESTWLEAEARLVHESKLLTSNPFNLHQLNKATAQPPSPTILLPCQDILKVWQGACTNTYPTESITISNAFFNSTGTLESSTSTLNHVKNSSPCSVRIAGTEKLNQYTEIKDGMENTIQVHDIACPMDSVGIEDFSLKDSV